MSSTSLTPRFGGQILLLLLLLLRFADLSAAVSARGPVTPCRFQIQAAVCRTHGAEANKTATPTSHSPNYSLTAKFCRLLLQEWSWDAPSSQTEEEADGSEDSLNAETFLLFVQTNPVAVCYLRQGNSSSGTFEEKTDSATALKACQDKFYPNITKTWIIDHFFPWTGPFGLSPTRIPPCRYSCNSSESAPYGCEPFEPGESEVDELKKYWFDPIYCDTPPQCTNIKWNHEWWAIQPCLQLTLAKKLNYSQWYAQEMLALYHQSCNITRLLSQNGIEPHPITMYSLTDIQNALTNGSNITVILGCRMTVIVFQERCVLTRIGFCLRYQQNRTLISCPPLLKKPPPWVLVDKAFQYVEDGFVCARSCRYVHYFGPKEMLSLI